MKKVLRFTRRLRRRFSAMPHWIRDTYGLLSYVNFVALIPTVSSIAFAPRHFFRRLPQTLEGKRPHYATPIKFFFNFATLFIAAFYLRNGELAEIAKQSHAVWMMPLLIPVTPIAMTALTIACWILYQVPRLAPNGSAFPAVNSGPFMMVLDPRSYANLGPSRFLWGLFYISIYFIAAWQVTQILVALNFLSVVYFVAELGEGHLLVKGIVIIMSIALVALSIHALVLHPYLEMFRASLRRPSRSMYKADVHEIRESIRDFLAQSSDQEASNDLNAQVLFEIIAAELPALRRTMVQQDCDFDLTEEEALQRFKVHQDAFQIGAIRERLQDADHDTKQRFETLLGPFDQHLANTPASPVRQAA